MREEMIQWCAVGDELPDEGLTVLIEVEADDGVSIGFLDAGDWRYASSDLVSSRVLAWAELPEGFSRLAPSKGGGR